MYFYCYMLNTFRYVFDHNLYMGLSKDMPHENGKKVFEIICPDFNNKDFEVIETGDQDSPYELKASNCANPFSQTVIGWFSDSRLLFG